MIHFEVLGEPASKANSRKLVTFGKRPAFIKSQKARDYVAMFHKQSRRPDLDESLILDCMQDKIYKNDRQVKQKKIYWGLDKENPRSIIRVSEYTLYNIPSYLL